MPQKKAEAGSLTGSKRIKSQKEKSAGTRAKKVAEAAGTALKPTFRTHRSKNGLVLIYST